MEKNKITVSKTADFINAADQKTLVSWADKFDVTKAKLKAAINAVGNSPDDVEKYLIRKNGR